MIGRWTSIALCRCGGWIVLWRNCKILKSGFQKRSAFASRLSNTLVTEERRTRFGIKGRTGRTVDPASGGISSPRSPPSKSQLATTSLQLDGLLACAPPPPPPPNPHARSEHAPLVVKTVPFSYNLKYLHMLTPNAFMCHMNQCHAVFYALFLISNVIK